MPTAELKDRLRKALELRNMKPIELSEKTKIPKAAISQYMSGYTKPKDDRLFLICKALNINEAWLLGYDTEMERKKFDEDEARQDAELLFKFSQLDERDKQVILDMVNSFYQRKK